MSGVQDDTLNILQHLSTALLHNPLAIQRALRQCREADGTYNMLNVVESLLKLSSVRATLGEITCHGNPQ